MLSTGMWAPCSGQASRRAPLVLVAEVLPFFPAPAATLALVRVQQGLREALQQQLLSLAAGPGSELVLPSLRQPVPAEGLGCQAPLWVAAGMLPCGSLGTHGPLGCLHLSGQVAPGQLREPLPCQQ